MKHGTLEHVNITVRDCDATAALLADLFGWHIRWQGPARDNGRTIHLGTDDSYVAIYTQQTGQLLSTPFAKGAPLNHIGVSVDDLDEAEARVIARGLTPFSHSDYGVARSFYFFDDNGIEFEVVSYR
ncbi:VOC family protein [Blastomonas sp.]|uniref:VOC family protein n=1 Tax=Blastomonas sp. TaxID=1909299 RepID=UPI003593D70C